MPRLSRLTIAAALALALGAIRPRVVGAEDAPPPSAPKLDPEQGAVLERAKELSTRVDALYRSGNYAEAIPLAREALAAREAVLGKDHTDVADSLNILGLLLQAEGSYASARPPLERALSIYERAEGKDHVDVATILSNLAKLLDAQRAYGEALPHFERALAIWEKARGQNDPLVALGLCNLAGHLEARGVYSEAQPLYERALAIEDKALGADHLDVAACLNRLALCLQAQSAYGQARPLLERALGIKERAHGVDAPAVALDLNNLGMLFYAQEVYAEARPLLERALRIDEKALGRDHPDVASDLTNLGLCLKSQGAYAEARPLFDRALAIYEASLGSEHPAVATCLAGVASLLEVEGGIDEARPLLERSLSIREAALGKEHPDVVSSLIALALLLQSQGESEGARRLFQRAITAYESVRGREDPHVAVGLDRVAGLLEARAAYSEARPLYDRALSIRQKALGKDHPDVAVSLGHLAMVLFKQGAFAEARPLFERALAIQEKALGKESPSVATTLGNLAGVFQAEDAPAQARPLLKRALAIQEKALGESHPSVAISLNNLATVLFDERAYAEARPLYTRALAIYEKTLGNDHPAVAASLNNLAALLQAEGAFAAAQPLYERALAIREKALGKDHPDVAESLNNLATLLEAARDYEHARPLYERFLGITDANARAQLSALSGRQRIGLLRSTRYGLDNWLIFSRKVGLSGYPEVLRFRGLVARAETAERILARHAHSDERAAQDLLQAAVRRTAGWANAAPTSASPEARAAWQKAYAEASAERERLTLELTEKSAPLRVALERLDLGLADVQAQLGPDAALVDFLRVTDRYLAWVVRSKGEPERIDVGAADKIDEACVAFVTAITDDGGVAETGAALRALVWAPIESKLGDGVARVAIVPDAALAAVPFAALPGKAPGRHFLDDLAISYVMNAQDLVPWQDAAPAGVGALLVGGVDYEHADVGTNEQPLPERPVVLASLDRAPRGGQFTPIPQTKVEVEGLRDRFGKDATTLLLSADATEARLRGAVKGRRFLHIATHGFAREDLLAGLYSRKIEEAWTSADAERQLGAGHDPMLLSGLAMAGANPREGAAGDDGILTAIEASYLDLDGVDLVTLSACETAKGTAESGEGVQGLVQAFQMAGARRVIASLWRVDDEGTRRLMDGVYERMLRKENPLSPADALREAALALRDGMDAFGKARFAAPRYWAAFVAYGR